MPEHVRQLPIFQMDLLFTRHWDCLRLDLIQQRRWFVIWDFCRQVVLLLVVIRLAPGLNWELASLQQFKNVWQLGKFQMER